MFAIPIKLCTIFFFMLFQSCSGPRLPCLAIAPSRNHSAFALVCEMEQKWVSFHINASPIEIFSFHFFTSLEYEWNYLWGLHDKFSWKDFFSFFSLFEFRCFIVFSQNVVVVVVFIYFVCDSMIIFEQILQVGRYNKQPN